MPFDENLRRTFDSLADRLRDEFARELAAAVESLEADAQSDRANAAERAAVQAKAAAEQEAAVARAALERKAADARAALEQEAAEARAALEREAAAKLAAEVASAEQRSRAAGRSEGHAQGRGEGHDEGFRKGLEEGRAKGLADGRTEGHAVGRAEGWAAGLVEGRREGRAEGRTAGFAEGRTEGRGEGWTEGREQGLAEGRDQGRLAGIAEGRAEGRREGWDEGWASGRAEGLAEGRTQGIEPGRIEGRAEHEQRLVGTLRTLDAARSLTEILDALARSAAAEAPRIALLVVRGWELSSWRFAGFGAPLDEGQPVTIHMVDAGLIADAVRSATPVAASEGVVTRSAPAFPGAALGLEPLAVPIVLGGRVVAALYADKGSDAAAPCPPGWHATIEAMTRHASRSLEAVTAFRTAQMVTDQVAGVRLS